MLIKSRTSADLPYSDVTPEGIYRSRREFMKTAAAGTIGALAVGVVACGSETAAAGQGLAAKKTINVDPAADPLNTVEQITTYNNYYEFGTGKGDPARNA